MEFKQLIDAFAEAFNLTDLKPDKSGIYNLVIDDIPISLALDESTNSLVTYGEVGALPFEGREKLYRTLLESMYLGRETGGAVFSIEEETELLTFHRIDSLDNLEYESFAKMFEKFVNILEQWQHILSHYTSVSENQVKKETDDALTMRQGALGLNGFMEV